MVYKTDGSPHHLGITNEHTTIEFLNNKSTVIRSILCPPGYFFVQIGGTRTKIDANIRDSNGNCEKDISISIKNHKGTNGTFDWVNTTENTEVVKTALANFKITGSTDRKTFNLIFSSHLKTVDDTIIRSILLKCASENPPWLIINNVSKNEYVLTRTPDLTPLTDWKYFLKFGRGTTSAQIWRCREDHPPVNTFLRLRLVSNNGFTALYGKKGSVPCFKLQQENVKCFIENLKDHVRESAS